MTKDEQVVKILADILGGCPMLGPCSKIWALEGWCKDHCKPGQQEPDAECWLKYAEAMVKEAENSKELSKTQKALDTISRQEAIDALMDEFKRVPTTAIRAKNRIERLSSAEPEIIHCRDCKHHHYESKGIPYCDRIDYGYGWKDDDFCSRSERRTNE